MVNTNLLDLNTEFINSYRKFMNCNANRYQDTDTTLLSGLKWRNLVADNTAGSDVALRQRTAP